MVRWSLALLILPFLLAPRAAAQDTRDPALLLRADPDSRLKILPKVTYWRPDLAGSVHAGDGGSPGSGVDVEDDLGIDHTSAWIPSLDFVWSRHRLRLRYESLRFRGGGEVDDEFTLHDQTFTPGEHIASEVHLLFYEGSYDYRVLKSKEVDLRVGGGLYFWQSSLRVDGDGDAERRSANEVMPVLTGAADATWQELKYGGSIALGTLGSGRVLLDAAAYAGMQIAVEAEIDIGYRWLQLEYDSGSSTGDLIARGPFLSLSIAF